MRLIACRSMLAFSTGCLLSIPIAVPKPIAAQHQENARRSPSEQWVQLFNGKDLTNRVEVGKEKWTIEDGAIHGLGVTNAYGYL